MAEQQQESAPENFELMDREDEEQILLELRGAPVEKFIYKNSRGDFDLSYAGTKWAVRKMAEEGEVIRVDGHPKVERCVIDPEYITVTILGKRVKVNAEAKSETVLDTNVGAARGWIKQKLRDNRIVADEFFFNKTVSKATRNLLQILMPQDFKRRIIETLKAMDGQRPTQSQQRLPQGQQNRPPQNQQAPPAGGGQGAAKPQGQQPPAGQGAQKPSGQGVPAQGTQKPQTQQGKPQQQQAPKNPNDATIEAVQQGFRAVFIQFAGTEDKPTLQKILKALTGKTMVTDLERGLMLELGPLLRRKIKGEVKWNGTALHEISTGTQLWPAAPPQEDPAPEPQHEEEPPPQSDEIPMF